ncbi:MAG: site-2 protease family protein [Lentisphaeria bacterium]|nr:site-2 protease family protein [Lentisphaeria bacterium]
MIFIGTLFTDPQWFAMVSLAVIPAICLHEYFHAQVALWCGDPTAALQGHLTLNPLKQMGLMSIIMFLFIGIAWGGVPVNPYNLTRRGRVLTALAGPLMNFVLFLLAILSYPLLALFTSAPKLLIQYIFIAGIYNLILMIFNLLPVPGLDGWNILLQFVKIKNASSEVFKGAMVLLIFGVFFLFPYLVGFAEYVMQIPVMILARGQ